ncbi:unnamed protein product [Effrenium voratum]|uniref:Phosphagen kinase C-terminal domain-containing protein n=1 Tax=Effrenium voratum TaxID=2562239 RepID=A0AA36MY02_9DINO|nr:unnamed protein product [Effrenium voratum]
MMQFDQFPGLGSEEYPGFPTAECPEVLPDLSRHCSLCADVLKAHPEIYDRLKYLKTSQGVGLARCIKTGIDNRGHPVLKALGAVAGDAECFDTFAPLFDKLIEGRHGKVPACHSKCAGRRTLTLESAEPFDDYVVSCKVAASRNLSGIRFPPAATLEDRQKVEQLVTQATSTMEGPWKGQYYPLMGSTSYMSKPSGMSVEEEKMLADDHLIFYHPDASAVLSTGAARHWPHGRGVFVNESKTLTLWVNEEEHLKATSQRSGGSVQAAFRELMAVLGHIDTQMPKGHGFAKSDRLGFLTSNPANLGTALRASAIVKLPLLKQHKDELQKWCASRRLIQKGAISESGDRMADFVEVSSRDKLNITEEETLNLLVEGIAQLVRAERLMEMGMSVDEALARQIRRDPTPVDPEDSWDAAGHALHAMISTAVVASCSSMEATASPAVDRSLLDVMQRLAGALVVASGAGQLEEDLFQQKEEAAAVRIQARERGRKDREAVQQKKQDVERARAPDVEMLRNRLADVLARAADDGSLQEALATTQPPQDMEDDEKEVLRLQLESTLERGGLAQALQEIKSSQPDMAEVRLRLQGLLVQSLAEGTLDSALNIAFEDDQDAATIIAEPEPDCEGDIDLKRVRMAQQLEIACMDGSLESTLASMRSHNQPQRVDHLRAKMAAQLEASLADGSLEAALAKSMGTNMDALRNRTAALLEASLADGSLEAALARTTRTNTDALRNRTAALLEASLVDGSLEAALSQSKQTDIDILRTKVASQLEKCLEDGSLETALANSARTATCDVEVLRVKVAAELETALANGSLEAALQERLTKRTSNVDAVRAKVALRMEEAAADGALESLLSSIGPQNPNESGDLREKLGKQLSVAFQDGSLEAALEATSAKGGSGEPGDIDLKSKLAHSSDAVNGSLAFAQQAEIEPSQEVQLAKPARPSRPPSAQAMRGAVALLKVMSSYDRRIGKLLEGIETAERAILARSQQATVLQVQLEEAQRDLRGLDLAWERQQLALDNEEVRDMKLHEEHQRLNDSLELERLKQKHATVDSELLLSARSELGSASTASGQLCPSTAQGTSSPMTWRSHA